MFAPPHVVQSMTAIVEAGLLAQQADQRFDEHLRRVTEWLKSGATVAVVRESDGVNSPTWTVPDGVTVMLAYTGPDPEDVADAAMAGPFHGQAPEPE